MKERGLSAYVLYSSDPHGSEYLSPHWEARAWLSGFKGSAGTLVVTQEEAGLWTDFRYFIQADKELGGSGIDLYRVGETETPPYDEWIRDRLSPKSLVGLDERTLMLESWETLQKTLGPKEIDIRGEDLLEGLWTDRPPEAFGECWALSSQEAGLSVEAKIEALRQKLQAQGRGATLISSLDDIAWLLNVRGEDVPHHPVIQSYLFLSREEVVWFVTLSKVPGEVQRELGQWGVELREYGEVLDFLKELQCKDLFVSGEKTSLALINALPKSVRISRGVDITSRLKAQKNEGELKRIRLAMERDGVAMVRFIREMRTLVGEGQALSELEAAAILRDLRAEQEGYLFDSFTPIPGYGPNGALCHYKAEKETAATIGRQSLFLIDSGGQYRYGTTDITRTLIFREPNSQEKRDYTLVLKGHIALSRATFPAGTRGYQLDLLARQPLWDRGLNYGHGTGHGVGYVLGVHEGPQSVSPHPRDEALLPGMILSNEPGIYREGEYGIRIENIILVKDWEACPEGAGFYEFETLTLCPYEPSLIDTSLLMDQEIRWINAYHRMVFERLAPHLSREEQIWLGGETVALS